jgi:hypothetical protein
MGSKRGSYVAAALAALAFGWNGCAASEDGKGTLVVEMWGEEYIETGIPSSEFADGWGITYDRFLINLGAVTVAEEGADPAVSVPAFRVWNLHTFQGPELLVEREVPAGSYVHTAYTIQPATADSVAGNATDADVQAMVAGGYAVLVEGTATKGDHTVAFSWGFQGTTAYDPCHSGGALEDGGTASIQLTFHGDHLFYDDAASTEPSLRFEDLALADADGDETVTPAELQAYEILALDHYGVGSLEIDTMWDYLTHMTTTLGHIDGEGHCETH